MRRDAIEAVIRAIEEQEIKHLGFNAETYFAKVADRPGLQDKSRLDNPYVGDIAAYAIALFHFDGKKRASRLTVETIGEVIDQVYPCPVIEIVGRIFGIDIDTARELLAPENFAWCDITPEIAIDVLVDLYHTGAVHWPRPMVGFLPTLTPEQLDRILRTQHKDRASAQTSVFSAVYGGQHQEHQ